MNIVDYVKQFPLRTFERGELLLQKETAIDSLLAIRTGFVKISSINNDGVEHLVSIVGRYDIAPTEQLFTRAGTTRFFYTALTDGTYYKIDKQSFLNKAKSHPELMTEIAQGMSVHYDDFLYRVDAIESSTTKERLLKTLLYLAERLSSEDIVDLYECGLALTHADLASMIGSTRETTSLTLNEVRKNDLIAYSRKQFLVRTFAIKSYLETSAEPSNT